MGLISTGSVFVDVSKLLGFLQSSWSEGGAAVRQWVVLAASEERECQNRLKRALPLSGEHISHFCRSAPLRRRGLYWQDSLGSPRVRKRSHSVWNFVYHKYGIPRDSCGPCLAPLYHPHSPCCLSVLSCYVREFVCPAFLFSCQL